MKLLLCSSCILKNLSNSTLESNQCDNRRFVKILIQNSPLSNHRDLLQRCLDGIEACKESFAFGLLLVSLPVLESLRFIKPQWNKELLSSISTDPSFRSLSKLFTIESYRSNTDIEDPVDAVVLFALVYSVPTLKGRLMSESANLHSIPNWTTATSRLEHLELSVCATDVADMRLLLLPMRNLKQFRYCQNSFAVMKGRLRSMYGSMHLQRAAVARLKPYL